MCLDAGRDLPQPPVCGLGLCGCVLELYGEFGGLPCGIMGDPDGLCEVIRAARMSDCATKAGVVEFAVKAAVAFQSSRVAASSGKGGSAAGAADDVVAPNRVIPDGVSFGRSSNQDYHVWRHVEGELGMSRQRVQAAVVADLPPVADLSSGLNVRFVNVDGVRLQYNAFKLPDGTVNIGRIHAAD